MVTEHCAGSCSQLCRSLNEIAADLQGCCFARGDPISVVADLLVQAFEAAAHVDGCGSHLLIW